MPRDRPIVWRQSFQWHFTHFLFFLALVFYSITRDDRVATIWWAITVARLLLSLLISSFLFFYPPSKKDRNPSTVPQHVVEIKAPPDFEQFLWLVESCQNNDGKPTNTLADFQPILCFQQQGQRKVKCQGLTRYTIKYFSCRENDFKEYYKWVDSKSRARLLVQRHPHDLFYFHCVIHS